jgi:acyl dehydratase
VDAEWCKTQPFGQRIAHGTLVFSIGIGLTAQPMNPRAMSYGYDRLHFIKPVFIGDTVHTIVRVREKRDDPKRPQQGIVVEACEVINNEVKPFSPVSTCSSWSGAMSMREADSCLITPKTKAG